VSTNRVQGKPFGVARMADVASTIGTIRYYAGWADKIQGKVIETNDEKLSYTRHEPYGVVVRILVLVKCDCLREL
jgi:aldehyde dehydrogenase (NAD+)